MAAVCLAARRGAVFCFGVSFYALLTLLVGMVTTTPPRTPREWVMSGCQSLLGLGVLLMAIGVGLRLRAASREALAVLKEKCIECGYDLGRRECAGPCPECGHAQARWHREEP
ncbi:MAG: hypothetical protein AMXMBFR58_06220 [Phycisphaerae bacterium]